MTINKDLEQLTNIPEHLFNKITDLISDLISHYVVVSDYNNDNLTNIDLGFGILQIYIIDDEVNYKFIPSSKLEQNICDEYINKEDILITKAEQSLKEKFMRTYKELF